MASIKIYNQMADQVGELELNEDLFGIEYNEALIHQVVVAQRNNARQGTKCTLTRTEVRGGGIKPWRQKGTGRARQGSIRAPQWVKGGVVFAPKPRDFSQKVNKFAKRLALVSALAQKVRDDDVIAIDSIKIENGKTKQAAMMLKAFGFNKRVLLTEEEKASGEHRADRKYRRNNENKKFVILYSGENDELVRAVRNIPGVTVMNATQISVYDVVANSKIIATVDAIKDLESAFTKEDK